MAPPRAVPDRLPDELPPRPPHRAALLHARDPQGLPPHLSPVSLPCSATATRRSSAAFTAASVGLPGRARRVGRPRRRSRYRTNRPTNPPPERRLTNSGSVPCTVTR